MQIEVKEKKTKAKQQIISKAENEFEQLFGVSSPLLSRAHQHFNGCGGIFLHYQFFASLIMITIGL